MKWESYDFKSWEVQMNETIDNKKVLTDEEFEELFMYGYENLN